MFSEVALGLVFTMPVTHCVSYLSRGSKVPKIYRIKTIMMYYCSWFSGLAGQRFRWYVPSHSCCCRQLKAQLGLPCPRWPHLHVRSLLWAVGESPWTHLHVAFHPSFFTAWWFSTGISGFQESMPQSMKADQTSACVTFANVQLIEASHLIKPIVSAGGDYTRTWIPGEDVIHWGPLM